MAPSFQCELTVYWSVLRKYKKCLSTNVREEKMMVRNMKKQYSIKLKNKKETHKKTASGQCLR